MRRNFCILLVSLFGFIYSSQATPLDDYVWAPDDAYNWVWLSDMTYNVTLFGRNCTVYVVNMTSQKWLTDADFDPASEAKSIWWHMLAVLVPDNLRFKQNASLWITNGYNSHPKPDGTKIDENILVCAALSLITGSITGSLFQIPNQHIIFATDPQKVDRREDQTIAFTWTHFLDDPTNPNWLIRFPMVKASVLAMDTMTAFVSENLPELGCQLNYYQVSGASKRGWTTYLVGAVNPSRVRTIIPVVLDAINFIAVMHHEYKSFGAWGYALEDYREMNITMRFDDPNIPLLQQMEDPYFYRERLTMPKFVVSAAMDEFMMPDDANYWWDDMPGPKYFMLAPNTEHEMPTGLAEIVPGIGAFIIANNLNQPLPKFEWTIDEDSGEIVAILDYDGEIAKATLWWAYSCGENHWDGDKKRRDFRIFHLDNPCHCGNSMDGACINLAAAWWNQDLQPTVLNGKRVYKSTPGIDFPKPENGTWVASMIAFKFYNPNNFTVDMNELRQKLMPYKKNRYNLARNLDSWPLPEDLDGYLTFNTEASVWPNTFPYSDCNGADCNQQIV